MLILLSAQVLQRIYSWDTFISSKESPYDSGTVAVVDGCTCFVPYLFHVLICSFFAASLLLTPFRSQNIPPPMSSYQLALSPELLRSLPFKLTAPIHVTFSPESDDLAILWESGYFEIWTLHIRLVPGLGKIVNPSKIWGGFSQAQQESDIRWRQILLRSNSASGTSFTMTMLGTGPRDQSDTVAISTVEEGVTTCTIDFPLPSRNCRLITGTVLFMYQTPDGGLFTCKSYRFVLFFVRSWVNLESRHPRWDTSSCDTPSCCSFL